MYNRGCSLISGYPQLMIFYMHFGFEHLSRGQWRLILKLDDRVMPWLIMKEGELKNYVYVQCVGNDVVKDQYKIFLLTTVQ